MYDLLVEAAQRNNYSAPTYDGGYLTVRSLGALKFAILSILEYTGVVFLDNSFHQKGIAADPASAIPGYVLGGLAWYAMPFTLVSLDFEGSKFRSFRCSHRPESRKMIAVGCRHESYH